MADTWPMSKPSSHISLLEEFMPAVKLPASRESTCDEMQYVVVGLGDEVFARYKGQHFHKGSIIALHGDTCCLSVLFSNGNLDPSVPARDCKTICGESISFAGAWHENPDVVANHRKLHADGHKYTWRHEGVFACTVAEAENGQPLAERLHCGYHYALRIKNKWVNTRTIDNEERSFHDTISLQDIFSEEHRDDKDVHVYALLQYMKKLYLETPSAEGLRQRFGNCVGAVSTEQQESRSRPVNTTDSSATSPMLAVLKSRYYAQDLHSAGDLMQERIAVKFSSLHAKQADSACLLRLKRNSASNQADAQLNTHNTGMEHSENYDQPTDLRISRVRSDASTISGRNTVPVSRAPSNTWQNDLPPFIRQSRPKVRMLLHSVRQTCADENYFVKVSQWQYLVREPTKSALHRGSRASQSNVLVTSQQPLRPCQTEVSKKAIDKFGTKYAPEDMCSTTQAQED